MAQHNPFSASSQQQQIASFLKHAKTLPAMPSAALHIMRIADDELAVVNDLVRAVQLDPSISAKILQVANSPAYGRPGRIETLRQASVMIGFNGTLNLALSLSMTSSLQGQAPGSLDHTLYWRRSLLAATASRLLAATLMPKEVESLFFASLMQDLGMLIIDAASPDFYQTLPCDQVDHGEVYEAEQRLLGFDHAILGATLATEWGFSDRMVEAIAFSHLPESDDITSDNRDFARCATLAGYMADLILWEEDESRLADLSELAEKWLSLDAADVNNLFCKMIDTVPRLESLFDTRLMAEEQLQKISDMAQQRLEKLSQPSA